MPVTAISKTLCLVGLLLSFSACATLPKDFPATVSTAFPQTESCALKNVVSADVASHPGLSGFSLLNTGPEAFQARVALAEVAEHSIDAQYFIWKGDPSGVILLDRLVKAADRGVRVRLLLDDMTSHGKDLGLAVLNQHPNIQVRLFNPLGRRYYVGLFRTISMAFHAGRMTNRMHNKIFAVDNQVAIVGGRNIGDEYFGVDPKSNFRDMDLWAMGPIVKDISDGFDAYWNSPWSVPFEVFQPKLPSAKKMEKTYKKIRKYFDQSLAAYPIALDFNPTTVLSFLDEKKQALIWGGAHVVADPPNKAWKKAERGTSKSEVVNTLAPLSMNAAKEILLISPYLILPDKTIHESVPDARKRGVSVKILTNSLSSTDAVPVVAMYRTFRKDLLAAGAELYEIRPDAASRTFYDAPTVSQARFSLHAKVVVFDRKKVFVGTFNVDPRSEYLNTEVGLLIDSPALAAHVAAAIDMDLLPENSYRLTLTEPGRDVRWQCTENEKDKIYTGDPHAGPWLRFEAWFLALLPIQGQL